MRGHIVVVSIGSTESRIGENWSEPNALYNLICVVRV